MRSSPAAATPLLAALALGATPATAHAQDPATTAPTATTAERTVPTGVRVHDVAVGGLTEREAAERIRAALGPRVERDTVLRAGGRRFRMRPGAVDLRLDATTSAIRAARADPGARVPAAVDVSYAKVVRWVATRPGRAGRAARSAQLRIGVRRMRVTRSRRGWRIDRPPTVRLLLRTVRQVGASRNVRKQVTVTRPAVSVEGLRRRYRTIVTVDRRSFRLRLFKRLRHARTYRIAVGKVGHRTPAGLYRIQSKQRNPVWVVPNSDWAGSLAGQTIPAGDPRNPIRGRWLGISGSIGIHGTRDAGSIGRRASHGCIRMRISSVKRLYPRVPVGTRVKIV